MWRDLKADYASLSALHNLPVLRKGEWIHITDSHDVTGGNEDGFQGIYSYLYKENGQWVLLDVDGPGCVFLIRTAMYAGEIAIYLDGSREPVFRGAFSDLYSGKLPPFLRPFVADKTESHGSEWSFVPIPFSRHCKITAAGEGENEPRFYNIWCRLFRDTPKDPGEWNEAYETARTLWERSPGRPHWPPGTTPRKTAGNASLGKWSTTPVFVRNGEGIIGKIRLRFAGKMDDRHLQDIRIKAYWDDLERPCVDAPLGLFFGVGEKLRANWRASPQVTHYSNSFDNLPVYEGMVPVRSLFFGEEDDGAYYNTFPMPFRKHARIELVNDSGSDLGVCEWEIEYAEETYRRETGYFCAAYRREEGLIPRQDYTVLSVRGHGHYVGCVMSFRSRHFRHELKGDRIQRLYLEGDSRFYIDDSRAFLVAGTGTEEYFNWGWYDAPHHDAPFSLPTHGYPVHRLDTQDYSVMYRIHPTEFVPFYRSFRFMQEHGPVSDVEADYASVAFYYWREREMLRLTDELSVGCAQSEGSHGYIPPDTVWEGEISTTYEGNGQLASSEFLPERPEDRSLLRSMIGLPDRGRIWRGASEFVLRILPGNEGVKLRRRGYGGWIRLTGAEARENMLPAQQVRVFVDGSEAGIWRIPPQHARDTWMEHDFELHPRHTEGKEELRIRLVTADGSLWHDFRYWAFVYVKD